MRDAGVDNGRGRRGLTGRLLLGAGLVAATAGVTVGGVLWLRPAPAVTGAAPREIGRMIGLPGGSFRMGNDLSPDACERPARPVVIGPFHMDAHEVTNRQFAEFVGATGYVTTAQKRGWSLVLDRGTGEWREVAGADWQQPAGPDSTLRARHEWPVVHVSWYDARAFARWAGKELPSEAQWEYAARAGWRDCDFPWGPEELIAGRFQANYCQGFIAAGDAADGFDGLAPVMSFPPNGFGLYDLSGNVWEWCADWYAGDYYAAAPEADPRGPAGGHQRVVRGGSWATAKSVRPGYTVWVRWSRPPEHTSDQVGFRCVR